MDRIDVFAVLDQAAACRVPDALRARVDTIAAEADWYHARIEAGEQPVYGATTLTGHLDSVRVPAGDAAALQQRIIDSHCIGSAPFHPPATARLIGHAKAHAVAAGGSGLSPAIYAHLLDTLGDPAFEPQVPANASYSCGDVIPGAHWARALLAHGGFAGRNALQPGDALALVNGSFVDLGVTLAMLPALREALVACLANSAEVARAVAGSESAAQAEVSIRATPELRNALLPAAAALVRILGEELASPSANPLVLPLAGRIESQASFMSPRLSIAKSALAEAVLFASWACQGRIEALARRIDGLDVVQVPKLSQAWLEESRSRLGRRLFASGGSTSQGIEDLWSFGMLASAQLEHGIATWVRMEAVLGWLLRLHAADAPADRAALLVLLREGGLLPVPGDAGLHNAVTLELQGHGPG